MAQTATKITVVTAALIAITLIDINPPIEEGLPKGSPVLINCSLSCDNCLTRKWCS
jgi:hypothetical protein